jgi:hypothetical protein
MKTNPISLVELRQAAKALTRLSEAWPEGKGLALAVQKALRKAGLPLRSASLLARLLAPEGPLSQEEMRRKASREELTPEEEERLLRAIGDDLPLLARVAPSPALAPALGEMALPEPSPPPLYPEHLKGLRPLLREGGVFLVQGLPFRRRYQEALVLAEALANLFGLEGAFLATRTATGASRLLPLLEDRWGELAVRVGGLPTLPEEALSWLEGPGQALLAPFVIGPLDHALRAATRAPEALLRLAMVLRKVPVLPVPEEDPRLFSALLAFLRWAEALGRPVVLLSPALPGKLLGELLEALSLEPPPETPLPSLVQLRPKGSRSLPLAPWEKLVRVGEGFPERGAVLFATVEEAKKAYRGLTKEASLEESPGGYLFRKLEDGRTVLLLHGRLRLNERRRRERGEADLLLGTFWSAGEGLEAERVALASPTPLEAKEVLLGAEEVSFFSEDRPRNVPRALFAHAIPPKPLLHLPHDLDLFDPFGHPEVLSWWERGRAESGAIFEVPESFPSSHLPRVALRRGPGTVFLLPPSGKEEGAYLLRPVAERLYGPLAEGEWVIPISQPIPREVGV